MNKFFIPCGIGIGLSVYALYVKLMKKRNPEYAPYCDINENIQCSKVLTSKYSNGFGLTSYLLGDDHVINVPNSFLGIVFYSLVGILSLFPWSHNLVFYLSAISVVSSCYLAAILVFVLKDLCVVCTATYVINAYLLYVSYYNL